MSESPKVSAAVRRVVETAPSLTSEQAATVREHLAPLSEEEVRALNADLITELVRDLVARSLRDPLGIRNRLYDLLDQHAHGLAEKIRKVEVINLPAVNPEHVHFVRFGFNLAADLIDPEES